MTATPLSVLVVGGGYAGVLAAQRLAGDRTLAVTLVSDRDVLVHRVRLHETLARGTDATRDLRTLLHRRITRVLGRVARVSDRHRTVTLTDGRTLRFDALLVATGSRVRSAMSGVAENALWLADDRRAMEGFTRLRALSEGAVVTVVGGGLTAVEVAAEIAEAHPRLRVVMRAKTVLAGYSAPARRVVREALDVLGVTVDDRAVEAVREDCVVLDDGRVEPSAMTVWCGGFEARGVELEGDWTLDDRGAIAVDGGLRAKGCARVWVAGDVAAAPPGHEPTLRMACATAMPLGAHAADNLRRALRGDEARPFTFAYAGQCVSLGRRRGVMQFVDASDHPLDRVVTGRAGALVKAAIVGYVMGSLRLEGRVPGLYRWPAGVEATA